MPLQQNPGIRRLLSVRKAAMPDFEFTCSIVWSDPDLLELEASVRFEDWAGRERGYVTRGELAAFIAALLAVADGGTEAVLDAGQDDLGYVQLRVSEYGGARRLMLGLKLGRAAGSISNQPGGVTELQLSVPIERGQLAAFARSLDTIAQAEQGTAHLPLPARWP